MYEERGIRSFKRDNVVMKMKKTPKGGVQVVLNALGVTDTIIIPKAMRSTFADAFDLIATTLRLWERDR